MRLIFFILVVSYVHTSVFSQFTDKKGKLGFQHAHVHPALMGGGVVVFDMNNDGWEDIFLTGGLTRDMLLINEGNFQFEDATRSLPYIPLILETSGGMSGDFNNDGWADLFITTYDVEQPNILLINDQEGSFIEATFSAGIIHKSESIGGTLLDYNNDGWLDIYVNNYIDTARFIRDPETTTITGYDHVPATNFLYRNNQDGTFSEVAKELGVSGHGCTLASLGFINEGNPSIYVANDYGAWVAPNEYYEYDPSQDKFIEKATELNLDAAVYGMGIALGDIGNDLDLDWYVTNIGRNVFYESRRGLYHDETDTYEIQNTKAWGELNATSWGTNFFDVENDGDKDLFVANGFIPSANFLPTSPVDSNKIYTWRNGAFTDNTEFYNIGFPGISRGTVTTDLDLDGDLDILVAIIGPEDSTDPDLYFKMYENETKTQNNFSQISLVGTQSQIDAFGAEVYLYTKNTDAQMNVLYSGGTHCSQNSKTLHFGLGNATEIDSIVTKWPSGDVQITKNIPINQKIQIVEDSESFDILGCMNRDAQNYNPNATINAGCLIVSSSINLEKDDPQVQLFPNPINSVLKVTISEELSSKSESRLEILDISGRVAHTVLLNGRELDNNITFPSHLSNGTYVIKLSNSNWANSYIKQVQYLSR